MVGKTNHLRNGSFELSSFRLGDKLLPSNVLIRTVLANVLVCLNLSEIVYDSRLSELIELNTLISIHGVYCYLRNIIFCLSRFSEI